MKAAPCKRRQRRPHPILATRRTVLLGNRFSRLVSTCRQNRSFVTRRTKPGNSGRLPPPAAVQGRSSGRQQAVEAVAVPSVPSAMQPRVVKPARPPRRIARSTASTPACSSVVWGAWGGKRAEAGKASDQLFPVRLAAGQRDQCRTC